MSIGMIQWWRQMMLAGGSWWKWQKHWLWCIVRAEVGEEVDDSWGRTEMVSLDIVIVVMIPSGSTVVMTVGEEEEVEDVMSVTGYNVSVVDEPSGLTLVIVMAPSVSIGKLVIEDASVEDVSVEGDTVEVDRTLSVTDGVVVMVAVSEVVLIKSLYLAEYSS